MNLVKFLCIAMLVASISACEQQGPLEKAGEKADDAVEDAADAVKDATN